MMQTYAYAAVMQPPPAMRRTRRRTTAAGTAGLSSWFSSFLDHNQAIAQVVSAVAPIATAFIPGVGLALAPVVAGAFKMYNAQVAASEMAKLSASDRAQAATSPAPADWDEKSYLAANPDVAKDVAAGKYANGWAQYVTLGYTEGRQLKIATDAGAPPSIQNTLPPATAITADIYASQQSAQWPVIVYYRKTEAPPPTWWTENQYVHLNPDVKSAILAGTYVSGWDQYLSIGNTQNRVLNNVQAAQAKAKAAAAAASSSNAALGIGALAALLLLL